MYNLRIIYKVILLLYDFIIVYFHWNMQRLTQKVWIFFVGKDLGSLLDLILFVVVSKDIYFQGLVSSCFGIGREVLTFVVVREAVSLHLIDCWLPWEQ